MTQLAVVVLAAGKGKRMGNPDLPKVMSLLAGRSLISHVVSQAVLLHPDRVLVIVGHQRHMVQDALHLEFPQVQCVVQEEQLGTGHAVMQCTDVLATFTGDVLILSGDVPLLSAKTLADFISDHRSSGSDASVLSCVVPDPTGYGRIVRDQNGELAAIIEHRDATEVQQGISEINSGIYIVAAPTLFPALTHIGNVNAQREYYLTDIINILRDGGARVGAFTSPDYQELMGINTAEELSAAERIYFSRRTNPELSTS